MADPEVDHGFVFNDQRRADILGSLFFDVTFGNDETVENYIDRILFQLMLSIEEHLPQGRWVIVGHPPLPPPATSPSMKVFGVASFMVFCLASWAFGCRCPSSGFGAVRLCCALLCLFSLV
ncbi:hypothetical protein MA16_Dca023694 [Dendrobium catenatum]|uniref:Uncharacterized protein n=1 Tax=Dendrobium catenatum TaxID=906689 RepID=A0A2I0WC38_9ASPA|nr:hypothetical protein MA16_Dca023694 [Dendrobium catenatum]